MTAHEKKLIRRYLIWCYKTTQEQLDWIDRKFTQLTVDYFVLKRLERKKTRGSGYTKKIKEFRRYIKEKEKRAADSRYEDAAAKIPTAEYFYLQNRRDAIEDAIRHFLGNAELSEIRKMYQEEMTNRILSEREHR